MGSVPGPDRRWGTGTQLPPLPAPVTSWCLCPVLAGGFKGSGCPLAPVGDAVLPLPSPVPTLQGRSWDGPGTGWGTVSPGAISPCSHRTEPGPAPSSAPGWSTGGI